VERVLITLPHRQVMVQSTYLGWMLSFIAPAAFAPAGAPGLVGLGTVIVC
jgi:hypothetical protein